MIDWTRLSWSELNAMHEAGAEVLNCERVLAKTGGNIVAELLRGQGPFYEWNHYPAGDVYDPEFHAQYYYHAHPLEERTAGEHGHFHTFLRPYGMPPGIRPAPLPDYVPTNDPNEAISHLVGISMDSHGVPIRLFTTNRWVTGETWYAAADVIAMLDHFAIDHAQPSWPVNRWITAMTRLFKPQIAGLLHRRDRCISEWQARLPEPAADESGADDASAYEDRDLEVISEMRISIPDQILEIEQALRTTRRAASG